ncbi:MAG: precorrin-6y C5,15-methyltransferase (decarboxylating) subunit CbiE [Cellulosilyticaceae bacterium]
MPKLYIIGTGPGNKDLLTARAKQTIEECDVLLGGARMLEIYQDASQISIPCMTHEICERIKEQDLGHQIGVLASGDVGFYSITKLIQRELAGLYEIEEISGISSMQYFCAKIHESYEHICLASMHGRENPIVGKVLTHQKVFSLTGGKYPAHEICRILCENGLGDTKVTIGENLSYEHERIARGSAYELATETFADLAVMLIENPAYEARTVVTPGLADEAFIRGKVPMTKQEVRVVSLAKMQIASSDIIYDIGAGTGSVAIEMALQAREGKIYAIEKNSEGIELIKQNSKKFKVQNIEVVEANFPGQIETLPRPDKVFIGGSGGNLDEMIGKLLKLNPHLHMVVNAITLETLGEVVNCAKKYELTLDMVQLAVANSKNIGAYHMMMGQNPIFIITMGGKKDEQ